MSNFVKIFTGNSIITQRIVLSLKNTGINAIVRDQTSSGLDPKIYGGDTLQEIHVHQDELDKATTLINGLKSELDIK